MSPANEGARLLAIALRREPYLTASGFASPFAAGFEADRHLLTLLTAPVAEAARWLQLHRPWASEPRISSWGAAVRAGYMRHGALLAAAIGLGMPYCRLGNEALIGLADLRAAGPADVGAALAICPRLRGAALVEAVAARSGVAPHLAALAVKSFTLTAGA